jgi:PadR family transcriptional regulator, regulatory protein PadR
MILNKKSLDGNVETLLLSVLEQGPSYGYAIAQDLNARAEGLLKLGEGTIYPVLHRLEERQLITSEWQLAENARKRKYYRLAPKGKLALAENRQQWQMLTKVMQKVVDPPRLVTGLPCSSVFQSKIQNLKSKIAVLMCSESLKIRTASSDLVLKGAQI